MKKPQRLIILMVATILAIGGFQSYWLYQTWQREKSALNIKSDMVFRETMLSLQGFKFKLEGTMQDDSMTRRIDLQPALTVKPEGRQVVNMINMMEKKTRDSTHDRVFITVDRSSVMYKKDSATAGEFSWSGGENHMVRLLYNIDSLQDSLRVTEVDSALKKSMAREKLNLPFTVKRTDLSSKEKEAIDHESGVVVGIRNPVSYNLILGNSVPYLLSRMFSPLLFSFLLVGFTVLSFVLLYRNLMQQRRLTLLKNDFISNITHELKTPIATVSVAIEALRNFNAINDTRRTSEYLDISQNELQRLSLLVDKVLKLSMFEQKSIQLNKEWFDLVPVVQEVIGSMRLQLEKVGARLNFHPDQPVIQIHADKLHITSVIYNLLDNALKYSPSDPVINIELVQRGEYFELLVKDNGIGISSEYKEKIFEKFFRVPNDDKHNIKGYGLGLSYVSHIVNNHQGFIEVESEPGKGSAFTIKMPIQELPVVHFDKGRKISRDLNKR